MLNAQCSISKRAIVTICAGNYFPYARILLSSLQTYHPEAALFLCLADTLEPGIELNMPGVEIISADCLDIFNFADFAFRYDIMEFNTAVKPFVLQWLMEVKGFEEVLYLDPDIELFAPMSAIFDALASGANFVLTPHLTEPAEFGEFPDDIGIMKAGIYNLGFIGIKNSFDGISFLHWWGRRLKFQCLNQQDQGIFVDQKFVDLLPAFHDRVCILRDRTLNVAYWNLDQRKLTKVEDTWLVNGEPLCFFHFSGIDLKQPHRLSKHTTRFNGDLEPALQEIVSHYLAKLVQFNYGVELYPGYGYGKFNQGMAIANLIRRCYRDLLEPWLDNPFETFAFYLNQPSEESFHSSPWLITNLMYYLWLQRGDLQQAFNLQRDSDRLNYCLWFVQNAPEYGIDSYFITPIVENISQYYADQIGVVASQNDVCVIGYLKAETGVGQAGRMVTSSLKNAGIKTKGYNVTLNVMARQAETTVDDILTTKINSPIQIYNINGDQLGLVRNHLARKIRHGIYKINMPFWELSKFPQAWIKNYQGINEIWAASRFIQATLQTALPIPVIWMPPAVTLTKFTPRSRHYFKLPENTYLFHYNFDFSSFATRKNPQAAIKAYRLAFRNYKAAIPTALIIKTRGYDPEGKSLAKLQDLTTDEPDIYLLNQEMTHEETLALMNCCDCYISLHRSEGFGYTPAEAMLLEKPVIATNYSGTKDFINQDTGFPVNYKLVAVKENEYPWWQNQMWAEPDLNHAAWLMRKMISDETNTKEIALSGKNKILTDYSLEAIGKLYKKRLDRLKNTISNLSKTNQ